MKYEAVIGLEIHVQLNAATKLFCDCPNRPGDEPNRNTCPVCLWLPGALPKLSREALEKATLACLALNCTIQPESAFDQKVYYYPDLPKGFQLSQHHKPLARNGWIDIIGEDGKQKRLRIHHIHMEEDVAKLVHEMEGRTPVSLVDFNRAGTPLIEIVSEPDMRSPYDAMEYVKALRTQLRYTGSADCSMEQGTLRVDANISLRPFGTDELNTKVEVKNMNSIRNVGDAIAYEIVRQGECLDRDEPIVLHTRLWDPEKRVTMPMRGKFSGPCVPDPSVARIVVTDDWLKDIRRRLPEMPGRKAERFSKEYGLTPEEASNMSQEREISEFFEEVARQGIPPRKAASWITTHLVPALRDRDVTITETPLTSGRFARLLAILETGVINAHAAKEVLLQLLASDRSPDEIVEKGKYRQVSDNSELEAIVDKILADHPSDVDDFRGGNAKVMGFLMGLAMKASGGKANPRLLKEIFTKKLG
ncbi:MAG TPA: Asp-tRNA(Asn)/Glu-tRNA(Gln) amidotransferase subunit GatB [Syntrophorhabdaceae bacterium]|nr:Asp-tRNA(Asn)/Glu-tRNA(Gln) amidotransferase subunit GatB [Syntrophorhabdaceae bacterium]HQM80722.1 Asp-tRNA(Asn)/Glu-tRNA(Gln) amidotransferase subunit GatB [Syntrophorhabdaceae bacterium]